MKMFDIKITDSNDELLGIATADELNVVDRLALQLTTYYAIGPGNAHRVALNAFLKMEDRNIDRFLVGCVDEIAIELYKL